METFLLIAILWAASGWLCAYWAVRSWNRRWHGPITRYGDSFKAPIAPWMGMIIGPAMLGAVFAEIMMRNRIHD